MSVGVFNNFKIILRLIFPFDEGKEGVTGEVEPGVIFGSGIREDIFRSGGDAGHKVRVGWRGAAVDGFGDEGAGFGWVS